MTDDITDTGPLIWSKPCTPRREVAAHVVIGSCVVVIIIMLTLWGGR